MGTHQPVLLEEAIEALKLVPNGIYVDGTFGRGGHSQVILGTLGPLGRLIVLDKDADAIAHAKKVFGQDERVLPVQDSFANIAEIAENLGINKQVTGILLDLGVSSPQLDEAARGFSFMKDGPLDMRMNTDQPLTAERFVNLSSEAEMADVFKTYGEERFARRIARAIIRKRTELGPILTTTELAEIVKEAHPAWEKNKHPATRVFQAIRIYINQELDDLSKGLKQCTHVLAPYGRLAVISFHSLEDRIVKRFMKAEEEGIRLPRNLPVMETQTKTHFKRVGKAIKPTDEEIDENVRARSAVLRIGEKTS
ncbi:MAG: 16S rRNA (cytosine(1402)-N(4))-methyltransferase RsmH [Gammaproteobacteria bacterium]|nr:16S rRNA (cytosine(1402)-N(4))-methyltransferase RsmH [Gammaproteobacteria bacterium]MCH9716960.1 16S rRNA (cytosine(1402)-N(4))-methyltransferase RsmH [Gammaproteobacteria bacterium]MCH9762782.1 16S rRNA (cytosine(1402)-N(4))-methyltransferase RsmH [Gammaproteobacteria bacterium]